MGKQDERREFLSRVPNTSLSGKLKVATWILTGAVLILVGLMRRPELRIPLPEGVSLDFLPAVHAALNASVAVLLVAAVVSVKSGRIRLHKNLMLGAMGLSVVFLLGYVAYHFTNIETLFGDANADGMLSVPELEAVGVLRPVYVVLLITHIIAAAISLPMILLTFTAAWTNRFETHRGLAHWVFPIWLFVAITGPVCYLMLRPYYV